MIKRTGVLFILLLIEGAALMGVEMMGAKFLAPFFGNSLYVWTAVLAFTTFGLTLGYHYGGKISIKGQKEKILVSIFVIASMLVALMPFSSSWLISLSTFLGLIPGICVSSLLLISPLMFCFGLVGPIAVSVSASEVSSIGKTAGRTYFISTFGGILATFFFGFYAIPNLGLTISAWITASALVLIPILFLAFRVFNRNEVRESALHKTPQEAKTQKTDRKKTSQVAPKVKPSIFLFVIAEGAVVMAIEIFAARMIAPYFGSSLYVWGSVIGITLSGLALGYYIGGLLGDKFNTRLMMHGVLLIASILVCSMHFISEQMIGGLGSSDSKYALFGISACLLIPPLTFLGMLPSMLIRYLSALVDDAGSFTGKVFTLSSASGIITLFILGFYIIPTYGLTNPSLFIGFFSGLISFIVLITKKKYAAIFFPIIFLVSIFLKGGNPTNLDITIPYASEGLLGQILVADIDRVHVDGKTVETNNRILLVNRMGQTNVNKTTGVSNWNYIPFSTSVMSKMPENSNVLLLGLGGGTIANSMINLKFNVDAVELDERMHEVASSYFNLSNNVNVIIDDARHYIETADKKYDLIFFDVFKGDIIPAHVLTLECFEKVKQLLNPNGMVVVNFNGFLKDEIGKPGRSIFTTLKQAGFETMILPTPGEESERNNLFIATVQHIKLDSLRSSLLFKGLPMNMDSLMVNLNSLNLADAVVLNDDSPILELLNIPAANHWRNDYRKVYASLFSEAGIPLFR